MLLLNDMYNITKIEGGFQYNGTEYTFMEIDGQQYQVISNSQVHIYTDHGIILFDLICTINEEAYDNINTFVNELYKDPPSTPLV
jgi:hypothetical protein